MAQSGWQTSTPDPSRCFLTSYSGPAFLIDSLGKEHVSYGLSSHSHGILKLQPLKTIHTSHVFKGPFVSFLPTDFGHLGISPFCIPAWRWTFFSLCISTSTSLWLEGMSLDNLIYRSEQKVLIMPLDFSLSLLALSSWKTETLLWFTFWSWILLILENVPRPE